MVKIEFAVWMVKFELALVMGLAQARLVGLVGLAGLAVKLA